MVKKLTATLKNAAQLSERVKMALSRSADLLPGPDLLPQHSKIMGKMQEEDFTCVSPVETLTFVSTELYSEVLHCCGEAFPCHVKELKIVQIAPSVFSDTAVKAAGVGEHNVKSGAQ